MRLIVAAGGALLLASPALAGTQLWQNVEAGMTGAELRKIRPTVRPMVNDLVPDLSKRACRYKDRDIIVADKPYKVCFIMLRDRVQEVSVSSKGANATDFDAEQMRAQLSSKYGRPVNSERWSMGTRYQWRSRGVVIDMSYVDGVTVSVRYKLPNNDL